MNINEETQKLSGNPLLRYAILVIGLILLFFSDGILTWKATSARDAEGVVAAKQFEITKLEKEIADSDDSGDKKDMREDIKDIKEDIKDARMEAASEAIDARNGIWLWNMVKHLALALTSLGLIIISITGSNHEKVGALIALGFIITRL